MQSFFEMIGTYFNLFLFLKKIKLVSLTSKLLEKYLQVYTAVNLADISCGILFKAVKIRDGSKGINRICPSHIKMSGQYINQLFFHGRKSFLKL
jgi:hypothetical protein